MFHLITGLAAVAITAAASITSTSCEGLTTPPHHPGAPGCTGDCVFRVVETFPHDRKAFTQGLAYENGFLYEGTGLNGASTLRKVEINTGTVLQSISLPDEYFGEGITLWKDTIVQLTWQSRKGFVYDKATFQKLREFEYPTEGWGLTHDGAHLIMSDGTASLYFLDPDAFVEVRTLQVRDERGPVSRLNELEYINGFIYANVWQTDRIVRIDPSNGQVVGQVDLSGLLPLADRIPPVDVLNGIAYDAEGDRVFVTGKWWPKLFHIDFVERSR